MKGHLGTDRLLSPMGFQPGHVVQSVGHLTLKSEVLDSIPSLAT